MVLYNSAQDEWLAMRPDVARLYVAHEDNPDALREIHPELYAYLCQHGFLIEENSDEAASLVERWDTSEREARTYSVTVNPTLDCNMGCWYCYEKHGLQVGMSPEVRSAVLALVRRVIGEGRYEQFSLSFFGGEPLLYYDEVVRPLVTEAAAVCKEAGVAFSLHFTTNAYLLTDERIAELAVYDTSFQITIDGNEQAHNRVRRTVDGQPTYAAIVAACHKALAAGCSVGVRFNYTAKVLPTFIDVLPDFEDVPEEQRRRLNFNFQRVWQDQEGDVEDVLRQVKDLEERYRRAGFAVVSSESYRRAFCYADRENCAVVNYDGRLFSCTARDFTPENSEGKLLPDGTLAWDERRERRMALKYGNATCRACRIYPLCHGGCTQMKLEYKAPVGCLKGYTEEQKTKILSGRMHELIASRS